MAKKVRKITSKRQMPKLPKLNTSVMQNDINAEKITVVAKLSPAKIGITLGILFAVWMVIAALWVMFLGRGQELVFLLSKFYAGYSATYFGLGLGALYGLIDGFICGFLFAWIYNKMI